MNPEGPMREFHEKAGRFRNAVAYTASASGFGARLIERDYYSSLILSDLGEAFERGLVFKGGTCLSKVHTDFYRLSEDLDFVVSMEPDAPRSRRRDRIAPLKEHFAGLRARVPCFELSEPVTGFNLSKQYIGRFSYRSLVTGQDESIKVEIGLRELILEPVEEKRARTLLTDPLKNEPVLGPILVHALSFRETFAEKFRAALTRREPAIRDYYDIDYAVRTGKLDPAAGQLLELVRQKLAVPGNEPVDVSEEKAAALRRQVEAQLKPVLRNEDFQAFDLDRVFGVVVEVADRLQRRS
jgi:predicted nucleotidyltransferase component of viral defense system